MMMCLLGLLRTERLAREMSAVTLVMEILGDGEEEGVRDQGGLECPAHSSDSRPAQCPSDQESQDHPSRHPAPPSTQSHDGGWEMAPRVSPAIKSMLQEVK